MIKEIYAKDAITFEYPPDGEQIPIIDPYDGCTLNCPYCFQQNDESWNKHIFVKKNMPELIKEQLKDWPKTKTIYIGSRCDPYMKVEEDYELTKKCLIELNELSIPVMIVTKSHHELLIRDISLITNYSADITVLLGMSNLKQLENEDSSSKVKNIELANLLNSKGVKVWCFITPILSGITDVEKMIENISHDIPIYLDRLRAHKDSLTGINMTRYIKSKYPALIETYKTIIEDDNDLYVERLRTIYSVDDRVKFVFD